MDAGILISEGLACCDPEEVYEIAVALCVGTCKSIHRHGHCRPDDRFSGACRLNGPPHPQSRSSSGHRASSRGGYLVPRSESDRNPGQPCLRSRCPPDFSGWGYVVHFIMCVGPGDCAPSAHDFLPRDRGSLNGSEIPEQQKGMHHWPSNCIF